MILVFHRSGDVDCGLLGCAAMMSCRLVLTRWVNPLAPSSTIKTIWCQATAVQVQAVVETVPIKHNTQNIEFYFQR
jgi:hypothetical protein